MFEQLAESMTLIVAQTKANLFLLMSVIGILFIIHLINALLHYRLNFLGIYPRHPIGLIGVVCSPFLHGNFNHLFFNAIPLFVLMNFMLLYSVKICAIASILIILTSGILTWLFGRKAIHVGASSVITGYWSFLVFQMYQQPSVISIILGALCIYYFAGIFFGILPLKKSTSWEGHLSGLVAGILTALALNNPAIYTYLTTTL